MTNMDCELDQPVCSEGVCTTCTSNDECDERVDTPLCDAGACVQCVANAQCDPATPVCAANVCRTCLQDAECDSGACGTDGACVAEAAIIYISNTSTSNDTCTKTSPCANFGNAVLKLSATRNHFVLEPGAYSTSLSTDPMSVPPAEIFIHGHGASLIAPPSGGPRIIDSQKILTIRDVTLSGATEFFSLSVRAPTTLDSVTISGAIEFRVQAPVVARNLRILNSLDTESILLDAGGELTIDGGVISGGEVGIRVMQPALKIHLNNMLISRTTGRAIEGQAVGELDFSTIVDSGTDSTAAPCAVACNANLRVTSSIIFQETCGGVVRDAAGPCTFASSIVSNAPAPGITNVDPQFVNRAGGDYHIKATSPAKDAVDVGPTFDFERDMRPRGIKFDIGADEAP